MQFNLTLNKIDPVAIYAAVLSVVIAVFVSAVVSSSVVADDKKTLGEIFYKQVESATRADWDKTFEYAKLERNRKAKEGLPPLSTEAERIATEGIKRILYNKAVMAATCAEDGVAVSMNTEESVAAYQRCYRAKLVDLGKNYKLSDYASAIPVDRQVICEMKSREFEKELRFPPYEFLRSSSGLPLFNYKMLNDCLLSQVK